MKITHASHLSDADLVAALSRLARGEREATVALIVHLAEFDSRRLYEGAGFSSLFRYCQAMLGLSEDATYNRIESARAARRYPVIVDMLVAGSLSPTTARLLARHLTPENHEELLAAASGKGKAEVEELLARRFPRADVPATVRKLPTPQMITVGESALANTPPLGRPSEVGGAASSSRRLARCDPGPASSVVAPAAAPPRALVRPLAPARYEIRFTATAEMRDKLRLAQDLLGHAIPDGDLAQVFDRALTVLIEDLNRKKFAATRQPRRSRGQAEGSRNIPAAVRRAVWARDGGRCASVSMNGRRCGERRFVEFHHVVPHAAGGKPTVDKIQLRCRAHNGHEVDLFYGPGRRYTRADVVREARAVYRRTPGPSTRSRTSTRSRMNHFVAVPPVHADHGTRASAANGARATNSAFSAAYSAR